MGIKEKFGFGESSVVATTASGVEVTRVEGAALVGPTLEGQGFGLFGASMATSTNVRQAFEQARAMREEPQTEAQPRY